MPIRITGINPKPANSAGDSVSSHLAIESFKWTNAQSLKTGISSREIMFDWIVNKKGTAYISKNEEVIIVLGAESPAGRYIRAVKEGKWTNDLLDLEGFTE